MTKTYVPGGVFAIDYGTSNSLMSYVSSEGLSPPLPLDERASDPTVFRSLLYFPHQDACYYGQKAIEEYNSNFGEGRFIRSVKKYLPSTSFVGSYIENRVVRLEDLIGYFLLEMRRRATALLGFEVDRVILGRPAKYSFDPERDKMAEYRMKKAAEIAGFKEVEFLPEPLAAAFDLRSRLTKEKIVLVVDLGGGTSDFTIIKIGQHPYSENDLLGLGGISLAGDAFDGEIMKHEVDSYFGSEVKYRVPLGRNIQQMPPILLDNLCSAPDIVQLQKKDVYQFFKRVKNWTLKEEDKQKLHRLEILVDDQLGFAIYEVIDQCKRQYSQRPIVNFEFDYPKIEISKQMQSTQFESFAEPLADDILNCMGEVVLQAGLTTDQIEMVYCTSGTSKLALVQEKLKSIFGDNKLQNSDHFHSVSKGLALRAQELFF